MSLLSIQPASILFINVSRIGDTLFATPAIRAVAAAWPQAKITVLGHPKRVTVLEHLPFIHEVGRITKRRAIWLGWLACRRFDLAFVYGSDEGLVAYALRIARRVVAFEQKNESINRKLFAAVPQPPFHGEHAVRQLLRLPEAVGIPPDSLRIGFQVTSDEIAAAHRRLGDAGIAAARPLIGLQVASFQTKAYRDWPIGHFAELCDRISERWPDTRFLIFGGPEEKQRTAWLKEHLGVRAALLAGLDLRSTGALMASTDLYIGVDTGPTHIMSAFDIPMISLHHCMIPSYLVAPLDHPCCTSIDHPRIGLDNCTETAPMSEIPVGTVFSAVERVLVEHLTKPQ